LTDLAEEVVRTRIEEEEEDKRLEEKEQSEELGKQDESKKKELEQTMQEMNKNEGQNTQEVKQSTNGKSLSLVKKSKPSIVIQATPEKAPSNQPTTPKSPRSPFKVSSAEAAEITDDLKLLWGELRKQKTELLWVLLGFTDTKTRKVVIRGIGTAKEGIGALTQKLESKAVQFGALRVIAIDEHARRPKFVGFAVVGSELTPSQKLQAMHAKEIQRDLFTGIHTTLEFPSSQDFDVNISKKLASLDKSAKMFDFGGNSKIAVSSLT